MFQCVEERSCLERIPLPVEQPGKSTINTVLINTRAVGRLARLKSSPTRTDDALKALSVKRMWETFGVKNANRYKLSQSFQNSTKLEKNDSTINIKIPRPFEKEISLCKLTIEYCNSGKILFSQRYITCIFFSRSCAYNSQTRSSRSFPCNAKIDWFRIAFP